MTTFTATPEPDNVPPRIRLDLDTEDPTRVFSKIEIRRDGDLIRAQAPIGSQVSVVYDYDAQLNTEVTYTATGTDGDLNVVFHEDWADLSGWSTVAGTPAVSGGKLISGTVERACVDADQLVFHNPTDILSVGGTGSWGLSLTGFAPLTFIIYDAGTSLFVTDTFYPWGVATLPGSGEWKYSWGVGDDVIESTDGTWSVPNGPIGEMMRVSAPMSSFTLSEGVTPEEYSETATTTLNATEAWLIHPLNPDLSISIDDGTGTRFEGINIDIGSDQDRTRDQAAEEFNLIGRKRKVVVGSGSRPAAQWTLILLMRLKSDRDLVDALVDDESPLLLRIPPSIDIDLPDGWYAVGTVAFSRVLQGLQKGWRRVTLPLTPVDPPVLVQGAQWTWADVLTTYETWDDLLSSNETWFDVLVGPQ